jgi:hypothetical protein
MFQNLVLWEDTLKNDDILIEIKLNNISNEQVEMAREINEKLSFITIRVSRFEPFFQNDPRFNLSIKIRDFRMFGTFYKKGRKDFLSVLKFLKITARK